MIYYSRYTNGIFTVRNEVAKVMFLQVCVCPQGRGYPRMPCRWYPSMPCSRSPGGAISACIAGGIPACLATGLQGAAWSRGVSAPGGLPGPRGLLPGGVYQHALRQTPPRQRRLLLWMVSIPLECILVNLVLSYTV